MGLPSFSPTHSPTNHHRVIRPPVGPPLFHLPDAHSWTIANLLVAMDYLIASFPL